MAGGHSLLPMMKLRLAAPAYLIDLGRIPHLAYIRDSGAHIQIGPLTTHFMLESSDLLRRRLTALSEAAGMIGDVQVRNRGPSAAAWLMPIRLAIACCHADGRGAFQAA